MEVAFPPRLPHFCRAETQLAVSSRKEPLNFAPFSELSIAGLDHDHPLSTPSARGIPADRGAAAISVRARSVLSLSQRRKNDLASEERPILGPFQERPHIFCNLCEVQCRHLVGDDRSPVLRGYPGTAPSRLSEGIPQ